MRPALRIACLLCVLALWQACGRATEKVPDQAALAAPRIAAITLKYQDSVGTREKLVSGDSLPVSLRKIVSTIRSAPLGQRMPQTEADTGEEFGLGVLCGCEAPYDSLEIRLSDGSLEKYRFYCTGIEKAVGAQLIQVDLPEDMKSATNERWDALRARFCPKGFGCGDGISRSSSYLEVWTDTGWEREEYSDFTGGETAWRNAVDSAGGQDVSVPVVFTLRSGEKSILSVTIDSVSDRYRAAADAFALRFVGWHREPPASGRYKITAVNYYFEK